MALPINIEDLLNKRKVEGNRIEFFAEQSDKVERKKGWIQGIPTIQEKLAANGSPRATFETTENRLTFLIHIPVHAGSEKTTEKIVRLMIENPQITNKELAAACGITKALKLTPDIKFVNDETLNEFVVTIERKDVAAKDRDDDREDRDKRDKETKDNSLNTSNINKEEPEKRDEDRDEETKDQNRVVRIPYKQLSNVQKSIIQYCNVPRTAKEIMDHIGYYNNSKNMSSLVKPLLELGFLEMTEPDKPNSKNQKYRKHLGSVIS